MRINLFNQSRKKVVFISAFLVLIIFSAGIAGGYFYFKRGGNIFLNFKNISPANKGDAYIQFTDEIYDKIKQNYWDNINDEQLSNIFLLAANKLTNTTQELKTKDENGVNAMIEEIIKPMADGKKQEFVPQLIDVVVANLQPFGRSRLLTAQQETSLAQTVNNVDPNTDLYNVLGVDKNATQKQIDEEYQKKLNELKPEQNTEAGKQQLASLERAHEALSSTDSRQTYDSSGAEPTVIGKEISSSIYYIQIKKFSPATLGEFQKVADSTPNNSQMNSLILDLRGNIGGAIDILPYMLGPFVGKDQYAYEFFHQGNYEPFQTATGWLPSMVKFKKVVVLVDNQTQSSAEVMAASLKKYNVGVLVGVTTKGWGTVEQVLNIDHQLDSKQKFSLMLVRELTLRDDRQPIEGNGVEPSVNIKDKNWTQSLLAYFNDQSLVNAVKKLETN